jgi:MoaA/NifB/PqqE/SkfB family radical SAM enzyme
MGQVKKEAVRQLIGHTKIIGWEDGYPVRGLAIPAEYSPAYVRSTARLYNSMRSKLNYPGLATLSVTNRCDCSCPHCFAYDQAGEVLSVAGWQDIIEQAMEMGVFSFVITGGEPLLNPDLPAIIRAVDPDKASVNLYTNGSQLAGMAAELHGAGLRRISVSLDFADEQSHDSHRKQAGLFNKALAGIEAAQSRGMLTGISTFVTRERFEDGTLEKIFELATRLRVNEITVYNALPAGRLQSVTSLKHLDMDYEQALKRFISSWWQRDNVPGIWWYAHISSTSNLGCTGGTSMFNISHRGEFRTCDFCRTSVGSVLEERLDSLWGKLGRYADQKKTEGSGCLLLR